MARGRGLRTIRENVETFKRLLDNAIKTVVVPKLLNIFKITAANVEQYRNADNLPIQTGNLYDSTGAAIYAEGKIVRFFLPRTAIASIEEFYGSQGSRSSATPEWGINELATAIDDCYMFYGQGIWLVIFSAVDYAGDVNEKGSFAKYPRGKGYFDKLKERVLIDIKSQLGI